MRMQQQPVPVNKSAAQTKVETAEVLNYCHECGMTYEVKPSTHMFFQMFLLWKSSG